MKITNPYSKNRFSRIDKFQRYLTRKLSHLKLKERSGHDFLSSIYLATSGTELSDYNVSIPDDSHVELLTINVAELISVEELANMKDGIKKLMSLYPPSFNTNDPNRIDDFYEKIANDIHGRRWSQLGNIKFEENTDIGNYVYHIEFQASQVTSSIIVLLFQIRPAQLFLTNIDNIINSNIKQERILRPKLKRIFKFWGIETEFPETIKNRLLEDHILELKWRLFSLIRKYLPTFFHENRVVSPSVLLYKVKQGSSSLEGKDNLFWESIGLPQSYLNSSTYACDTWLLRADLDDGLDDSIIMTCDSEIELDSGYSSIDSEIIYKGDNFIREVLPVLAVRKYTRFMSKQIATFRISTFKSITIKKINYKNIIRLRSIIEKKGYMLNRIRDEFNQEYLKMRLRRSSFEWKPMNTDFNSKSFNDFIVDSTTHHINETFKHSESLVKTLDSTVEILTLQTNFSIQRKTVMLTIVTIILAVVAIYLTYYQISENTPADLFNSLKEQFI